MLGNSKTVFPVRQAHDQAIKALIGKRLSPKERLIAVLYYYENLTIKEIAATLDLPESRVFQMLRSLLQRLRVELADHKKQLHV